MSGISIVTIDKGAASFVAGFVARAGDLKPLHGRIAMLMEASIRENFEAGGRPTKWKVSRRARAQRGQTLRDTNRLMNSINGRGDADKAVAGTSDIRARVLHFGARRGQFGTVQAAVKAHIRTMRGKEQKVRAHTRAQPLPWGNIPAREFVLLQRDDLTEIKNMVGAYLTGRSA